MNRQYILPILIIVLGAAIVFSWIILVAPELKTSDRFSYDLSYVGISSNVTSLFEGTSPTPIYTNYKSEEGKIDGNIIEILTTYTSYDALTNEVIWEIKQTDVADKSTGLFIEPSNTYVKFPQNTQKQNYHVFIFDNGEPLPFVFEEETQLDGLKVYRFSCTLLDTDVSELYPDYYPAKVFANYECNIWIEPITGNEIQYEDNWTYYTIENDTKTPIEISTSHTSEYATHLLVEKTVAKLGLFDVYDKIIPIIFSFTAALGCLAIILRTNINLKFQNKNKNPDISTKKILSKKQHLLITTVIVISGVAIYSWIGLITPAIISQVDGYDDYFSYVGKTYDLKALIDNTPPMPIFTIYKHELIAENDNTVEFFTTYSNYDLRTNEILWYSNQTNLVDKQTGMFIEPANSFFQFPRNTQKQNYLAYVYDDGSPQPFVFEEETQLDGLKVYRFSCKLTADLSNFYSDYQDKVFSDYQCNIWIEPITGDQIQYEENWVDYLITNNEKTPVEITDTHTPTLAKQLAIEKAKIKIELFYAYDKIIPIIFSIFIAIACFVSMLVIQGKISWGNHSE